MVCVIAHPISHNLRRISPVRNSIDLQLFLAVSGALFLPVRAVVMASQRGLDLDAVSLWDITIMTLLQEEFCEGPAKMRLLFHSELKSREPFSI